MKDVKTEELFSVLLCLVLLSSVDSLTWTGQPTNPTEAVEGNNVVLTWNYSLTADEQTNSQRFFLIQWFKFNLSSLVFDQIASKTFIFLNKPPDFYSEPLSPHIEIDRNHKTDSVTLHINDVKRDDEGEYKIHYVKDPFGPALGELVLNLTVLVPAQVCGHVKSGNETLTEGGNVSVYCGASAGYPKPSFSWLNLNTNKPENVHLSTSSGKICAGKMVILTCSAGDSNPAAENFTLYKNGLWLANVTRAKVGVFNQILYTQGQHSYSCVASNAIGNASSNNTIVEVEVAASVSVENHRIVVREGGNVTLHCLSSGFPRPNVSWVNNSNYIMEAGSILNLTNIRRHNREYICSASNACGNDSIQIDIDVQYAAEATGEGGNRSVLEGGKVLFPCPVNGNPEPNITWYKDNEVIEPEIPNAKQLEAGETGCYTCSAVNGLGPPVTITHCLIVDGPPWIIGAVAGVVLLGLVVGFVIWWVHKKRKCKKDTKTPIAEFEGRVYDDIIDAQVDRTCRIEITGC